MKTSFKNFFACDSHRHTLLGWNDANATSARMTIQLGGKDADVLTIFLNGGREIGVSPNGKFIAYFRENSGATQLCTQMPGSVPACVNEEGTGEVGFDGISLSDTGAVLYTGHTGESCFYKDMAHFSKKPSRGYSNGGNPEVISSPVGFVPRNATGLHIQVKIVRPTRLPRMGPRREL